MVDLGGVSTFPGVGAQHPSQDSPTYFLTLVFDNGQPKLHTSLPEFGCPVFTFEFGNWLAQAIGVNATSPLFARNVNHEHGIQSPIEKFLPSHSSKKRRREIIHHASIEPEEPADDMEAEEMVPLEIGNEKKVEAYYESAFRAFQQINCRQVAKAYIKIIEPRKQVNHPYNGGRGAPGEKRDPEKTKPDWWPAGVTHREPDHLKKPDRIRLLIHIFRKLGKSHGMTADKLEEAGRYAQRQIKPHERLDILDEIYKVRRAEECYERGEAGELTRILRVRIEADITADINAVIYVVNRDSKTEEDPQEIDDTTGAAYDPTRHLSTRKQEKKIEAHNTEPRTPPSSIIGSIEGISVGYAQPSFAICSSGEKRRSSQFSPCTGVECSASSVGTGIPLWLPAPVPTYPEHLGSYGPREFLDGMDHMSQMRSFASADPHAQELTPGQNYCTSWDPWNLGTEYVPQGYINTL
ncbi:hypothetical protein MauCBS54593_000030 [Microsporum audouinii]